jgi:hypothetical protein
MPITTTLNTVGRRRRVEREERKKWQVNGERQEWCLDEMDQQTLVRLCIWQVQLKPQAAPLHPHDS